MASADETGSASPEASADGARGRIRQALTASRGLIRVAYRDPEHVSERLTLYAIDRLAGPSRDWAQSTRAAQPDTPPAEFAEELRVQTAKIARIDGAVSGTPFLVALVPGYMTFLWQEIRMTLRTAALYGRDPEHLTTAAEMLALRGVHPDVETAHAALVTVQQTPLPERPPERRPIRHWVHSVYLLLVFGGFMSPGSAQRPKGALELLRATASFLAATAIWLMTWVLPVTFMIMMAWACETHARQLGRRALAFYAGEAASARVAIAAAARRHDRGHDTRTIVRSIALFVSVAIPIAFVALVDHIRNKTGVNWVGALGALVAVSLVLATVVLSNRT